MLCDTTPIYRPTQVAPSVGLVLELEQRLEQRAAAPASPPAALVVGDPAFRGWAPQLPGARVEAKEVCTLLAGRFGEGAMTLLASEAATKAAVVAAMGESTHIHLSTHGA